MIFKLLLPLITLSALLYSHQNAYSDDPSPTILVSDGSIVVTTEEAKFLIQDMTKSQRLLMLSSPEKFKKILYDYLVLKKKSNEANKLGLNKKQFTQWQLEKKSHQILSKALTEEFKKNIMLPDNLELLAKEYYQAHPEQFFIKKSIKVAHILLQVKSSDSTESKSDQLKLLTNIKKEIVNGLDFFSAAKKYSNDKMTAKKGGRLNYFSSGKMVAAFEDAAFSIKDIGDLSDIIQTSYGYHLIKLLDKKEQSIISYKSVKNKLINNQKTKFTASKTNIFKNSFEIDKNTNIYPSSIKMFLSEVKTQTKINHANYFDN